MLPNTDACNILIDHATDVVETIDYHIRANLPENNFFPHENGFVSLRDCQFPSHIEDPLEIVRVVLGDDHANQLEYEDDVQIILDEIEFCKSKLLGGNCRADQAPEGNQEGKEPHHSQAFQR
jgi:hypothetical protein